MFFSISFFLAPQYLCVNGAFASSPLAGITVVAWVLWFSSRNTLLSVKALQVGFFFTVFAQKRYIKEQFVYFWCVVGQELWEKLTLLGGEG